MNKHTYSAFEPLWQAISPKEPIFFQKTTQVTTEWQAPGLKGETKTLIRGLQIFPLFSIPSAEIKKSSETPLADVFFPWSLCNPEHR